MTVLQPTDQLTYSTGARLNLDHVDRVGSPRAALVFKPTRMQSYYLSFGTSFDPSAEALALTTKTANLGPVKARTYEVGSKTALLNGLTLTGALFRTEVDNAQTNDPENPTVTVLNGDQRVQGLEVSAAAATGSVPDSPTTARQLACRATWSGTPWSPTKSLKILRSS